MTLQAALSRFQDSLPHRPYCSDDLESGLMIRGRSQALKRAYIQHNPPALSRWLVFDIDRPEAVMAWQDTNLPPPTLAIQTPTNGHGHLLYALAAPVYTDPAARPKPIRYLAAIERTYTIALGADPGYAGLVTKNPLHGRWRAFSFRAEPYDLAELQEYVTDLAPANDHAYDAKKMGAAGRHCYLFDTLRAWAYRHVKTFRAQGGYDSRFAQIEHGF